MIARRIHCQVLEVPAQEDWLPRRSPGPRDLLPWADPYISSLVRRLEERYAAGWDEDDFLEESAAEGGQSDDWDFDPPSAQWQDDAFRPPSLENARFRWYPTVCGGFPLLDDGPADTDDER